jgi:hypothetical protein
MRPASGVSPAPGARFTPARRLDRSARRRGRAAAIKIGVSLPRDLVSFADEEAKRDGTSRSMVLARLLEGERVRRQTRQYLDRHGWDVAQDEAAWRRYQRRRMAEEYRDDEW